jgi:hypothetical protein
MLTPCSRRRSVAISFGLYSGYSFTRSLIWVEIHLELACLLPRVLDPPQLCGSRIDRTGMVVESGIFAACSLQRHSTPAHITLNLFLSLLQTLSSKLSWMAVALTDRRQSSISANSCPTTKPETYRVMQVRFICLEVPKQASEMRYTRLWVVKEASKQICLLPSPRFHKLKMAYLSYFHQ